jgi:Flavodoxin domain
VRCVIVHESMFGNTGQLAQDVADGLRASGAEVDVTDVRDARPADLSGCDLLVVGAPTHAFSLSRPGTREDAVRQGAEASRAVTGVREWLATLDAAFPSRATRPSVAVFDTRVDKVRHLPGSAAKRAARILRAQGFPVVDRASFFVVDVRGPASPGEQERARAWGAGLRALTGSAAAG